MRKYKPIVLIILDGWGISPSWGGNALAVNQPKNINRYWREYPHKVLQAFTLIAGKYSVVGDSRLGHSTIAAGRRIPQNLEIISESILKRSFYKNKVLIEAINHAKKNHSNLHLIGLISNGGIHSHIQHLSALIELCHRQNFDRVFIDAITDGIDTGPNDSLGLIDKIDTKITETNIGKYSSITGRQYAMDRIGDLSKTRLTYEMLTRGNGANSSSIKEAISKSYREGLDDFTILPTIINNNGKTNTIKENDALIFFNFRADRTRQLAKMFCGYGTGGIFKKASKIVNLSITTFTEYEKDLPVKIAFPRSKVPGTLGEVLSQYQEKQLRITESEKEDHVTYFFNCGDNTPFAGEDRKIIPSKKVNDPKKNPKMQSEKIAKIIVEEISKANYDFILVNFPNVDIMAHTGNIIAAGNAIQAVDKAVGKIVEANIIKGGATIITADHGNIEQMTKLRPEQDPEEKHTMNPVPFILICNDKKKDLLTGALTSYSSTLSKMITAKETLADIAPTVLELMGLPRPEQMRGHSLLNVLE